MLFDPVLLASGQVPNVFGVKSGFGGLPDENNWWELTPEVVQEWESACRMSGLSGGVCLTCRKDIHNKGGTLLESERGDVGISGWSNACGLSHLGSG